MESEKTSQMSDTELLDWLQEQEGAGLISDDRGNWAVTCAGIQSIEPGCDPTDVVTSFFVSSDEWSKTVREAILRYKKECDDD